jgi:hypothetical protein
MLAPMTVPGSTVPTHRIELLARHAEAKQRREAAPLGSDEYRAASEEVARIEIAIAAAEEPPPPPSSGEPSSTDVTEPSGA